MELFDTHAHLDDERFDEDRDQVIARMRENGVTRCLLIGADLPSSRRRCSWPGRTMPFMRPWGSIPTRPPPWTRKAWMPLGALCADPKVKAIGEIGLDYYYDLSPREVQKEAFLRQIALAQALKLPMVLHIRQAHGDALELLGGVKDLPRGVVHCYSGSLESAREYMRLGLMISFTGSVTFKNAHNLQAVAAVLPADRIMVETDSPYMAPTPLRGKRNEPPTWPHVLRFLAQLRGEDPETLAKVTTENAKRLFAIP